MAAHQVTYARGVSTNPATVNCRRARIPRPSFLMEALTELLSCFTFARMLESSTRMLDTDAGGRRAAARALGVTITRTTLRTPVRCHGTARMGARTDVRDDIGLAGSVAVDTLAQELLHDQVCT